MKWVKWLVSLVVIAAFGFVVFFYFTLRANRDSAFGSAWSVAYAAPEWALALAVLLFAGAILFAIHGARKHRLVRAAAMMLSAALLTLAARDLHYIYSRGEVMEASALPIMPSRTELGASELMCFALTDFGVTIRNPEAGTSVTYFRGIWPFAFTAEEMDRILTPC